MKNESDCPIPSTPVLHFVLSHGMTRWRHDASGMRRVIYIYSHPVIILCLIAYAICLTPLAQSLNQSELVASILAWVDAQLGVPVMFAAHSAFPDETRLFFGLWTFLMPIMVLMLAPRFSLAERSEWKKLWGLKTLRWQFCMIFAVPAILLGAIVGALIPGDPSFCKGCTTHSKIGLFVIYGLLVPHGLASLLAAFPNLLAFFIKSFSEIYLSRKK